MSTANEREILASNKKFASERTPTLLPVAPSKKLIIVTCMDSRLDPAASYGLEPGSAIVLRNAGGSTRDALRSIILATHILGAEEVFVVKHTHCGLLGATTELAHGIMKQNLGDSKSKEVENFEVLPIANLEESAKDDVAFLRSHPLALDKVRVTGWIYDTESGLLKKTIE